MVLRQKKCLLSFSCNIYCLFLYKRCANSALNLLNSHVNSTYSVVDLQKKLTKDVQRIISSTSMPQTYYTPRYINKSNIKFYMKHYMTITQKTLHNSGKYANGTYFASIKFLKYMDIFLYHCIMTIPLKAIHFLME